MGPDPPTPAEGPVLADHVLPSFLVKAYGEVVGSPPPVDQPRLAAMPLLKSKGAVVGGEKGGDGGGPAPQLTDTSATAASPCQDLPRVYSKANDGEYTSTVAACHELPWSPLRLP